VTVTDSTVLEAVTSRGDGAGSGRDAVSEELIDELMAKVKTDGLELLGDGGLIAQFSKRILERALDEELTDELGYERGDPAGRGSGNSRHGTTPKRVLTEIGAVDLDVPRDRNGVFDPKIGPKGVTRLQGFNENVIALYAQGMSTRDIRKTLKRFYGVDASPDLISRVTDGVLGELAAWQSRPLDRVYPIVYIDGLVIKVRTNGTVINRCAYLAVGVDVDGRKQGLGVWLGDGGEGAKFWLAVLTELRHRGVEDVIFVCCDGLKGLPDAIEATWPAASVQTCVVHLIRASLRYCSLEGPQDHHRRPEAHLHRSERGGGHRRHGHFRARARRPLPGHRAAVARQLGAVHPVPGLPAGDPQDRVHHESGRVDQLSDAKSVQNPGSLSRR
jgi:putative transposase